MSRRHLGATGRVISQHPLTRLFQDMSLVTGLFVIRGHGRRSVGDGGGGGGDASPPPTFQGGGTA